MVNVSEASAELLRLAAAHVRVFAPLSELHVLLVLQVSASRLEASLASLGVEVAAEVHLEFGHRRSRLRRVHVVRSGEALGGGRVVEGRLRVGGHGGGVAVLHPRLLVGCVLPERGRLLLEVVELGTAVIQVPLVGRHSCCHRRHATARVAGRGSARHL